MNGIINVYKEKGYTSHDVVAIVRKNLYQNGFGRVKVGHTGTLDPDATGVLPVCIGRATKFAEYIAARDKTYIAEIVLGVTTNTGDITGDILSQHPVVIDHGDIYQDKAEAFVDAKIVNVAQIEDVLRTFVYSNSGEYLQIPPMYSAIKIGGKKLYEIARKGGEIERPGRPVRIYALEIKRLVMRGEKEQHVQKNVFQVYVKCSKGTYIRTLAEDIGKMLGTGATMGALERVQSGVFCAETALMLDDVKNMICSGRVSEIMIPITDILQLPKMHVKQASIAHAQNGNPLQLTECEMLIDSSIADGDKFWLYNGEDIVGLYKYDGNKLRVEVKI